MIDFSNEFQKIKKILEDIPKKSKILILSHLDPDGITSAYVFAKILDNYKLKYKKNYSIWLVENSFRQKAQENENTKRNMKKYDAIFTLDFSLNDYSDFNDKITCVIDHHKLKTNANIEINPAFNVTQSELPSASAVVYALYDYLFGEDSVVKKLAFIGAINDLMAFASLPYLKIDVEDSDYFINKQILDIYYSYNTLFYLIEEHMEKEILEYLLKNVKDNLEPLLNIPEDWEKVLLQRMHDERKITRTILKRVVEYPEKKIIMLDVGSEADKYFQKIKVTLNSLKSENVSFIFKKLPNNLGYRVSGRAQKGTDLVQLIQFLKTKIPELQGGGHPPAAGFYFKPQYYDEVKELILENMHKFRE
jgi:nanoRNase/pAp phosphatase (c-di-AMP/oligoRNAs hydrolase)